MNVSMSKCMIAAVIALLLSGCSVIEGNAKYVGSGELPSTGTGKAYLKIDADTCDGNERAKGGFTYVEKGAVDYAATGGVSYVGSISKAGICGPGLLGIECECEGWPTVTGEYTSTNPAHPGSGKYYACFYNQREGLLDPSLGSGATLVDRIVLIDGPYAQYAIAGTLRGSVKSSVCTAASSASPVVR